MYVEFYMIFEFIYFSSVVFKNLVLSRIFISLQSSDLIFHDTGVLRAFVSVGNIFFCKLTKMNSFTTLTYA